MRSGSTPLIMTGNFTVYSYIEPFLAQVTGMLPDLSLIHICRP